MRNRLIITVAWLLCGCKAEPPGLEPPHLDAGFGAMPAPVAAPAAPTVAAPELTSLSTVALRGSSPDAPQIVVQTGDATQLGIVLPDGTFCVDVPLRAAQVNQLKVFAAGHGKASPPTLLTVVQAANLPVPAKGTCSTSGSTPTGGGAPSCSDADAACDPRCNGCPEDAYQPNGSATQAPAIALKSSHAGLQLCPCRADWFTFVLYKGQHIKIQALYHKTPDFDLDLALYPGADVLPQLTGKPPLVAATASTSNDSATRTIELTAESGGAYYLQISATTGAGARGSYTLTTDSK
jgi:hypothetical protein